MNYPVIHHFENELSGDLLILRDKRTPNGYFRDALWRISYKLTEKEKELNLLPMTTETVTTGNNYPFQGKHVDIRLLCLVAIERTGLISSDAARRALRYNGWEPPQYFTRIYREHDTAKPIWIYGDKIMADGKIIKIDEGIIATGGTAVEAIKKNVEGNPLGWHITAPLSSQAALEGELVDFLAGRNEPSYILVGAIDDHWEEGFKGKGLDKNYYVAPGVGDMGKRAFGLDLDQD
ncbi:MAG: hypothetical protein HYX24_06965 [Candidatus Aenigmarchaeota archaeon]|nr:hypothetical protein [Candidatus Aenigmarchaeota archaeon]